MALDPMTDPRVLLEVARRVGAEHLRRAESLVHAIERVRRCARRELALASEFLTIAERAAVDAAVRQVEEREIARVEWER